MIAHPFVKHDASSMALLLTQLGVSGGEQVNNEMSDRGKSSFVRPSLIVLSTAHTLTLVPRNIVNEIVQAISIEDRDKFTFEELADLQTLWSLVCDCNLSWFL